MSIISYASALLGTVSILGRYILFLTIIPLANIYRLGLPKDPYERKKYIKNAIIYALLALSGVITMISGLILFNYRLNYYEREILFDIFIFSALVFILIIVYILIRRKNKKI